MPKAVAFLKDYRKKHHFDAIAFSGSSGAALAFPLSFFLKLPLIHVRKKDRNHFGKSIEGTLSSKKYIVVDDFIFSGATVDKIIRTIQKEYTHKAEPVAICLYDHQHKDASYNDIPIIRIPKR